MYDLPTEINRLLNLRHLLAYSINDDVNYNLNYRRGVKVHGNIGCLTALQKLSIIEVDEVKWGQLVHANNFRPS